MNQRYLDSVVQTMRAAGIRFAPGLSTAEIEGAESAHGFRFPPDLRRLLSHALPEGEPFPNWREPGSAFILDRLSWPADSICFDIEHDNFWFPAWGERPAELGDAKLQARTALRSAPFLIPIFGHRYLPATPCAAGNPVFSVYQTDTIYYGFDLPHYLHSEFGVDNPFELRDAPVHIEFWSDLEEMNGA